jgi:beta-galactosidase
MAVLTFPPIIPQFPYMLHGGDYNPDQWLDAPQVLADDRRLMGIAGVNALTIGVFSWASLEPEEGRYTFEWLDTIMDAHAADGRRVLLATPSGGKPHWLAKRYPEICQVALGTTHRTHQRGRHNHCNSSTVYREKVRLIDEALAKRYGQHPALGMWHIGNEFRGHPCWCENCFANFRTWLRVRYDNDLDALNRAWWSRFWSHTYTDWDEITPPDGSNQGLSLAWKRFCSANVVDFLRAEINAVRRHSSAPVTTNLMGFYMDIDPWTVAPHVDVVSWDSYPAWHGIADAERLAARTAFAHDLNRSLKRKPFLLIESTPSGTNWQQDGRPKRPGMHRTSQLQAIAHGSDGAMMFQWRKGRGDRKNSTGRWLIMWGMNTLGLFAKWLPWVPTWRDCPPWSAATNRRKRQ